MRLHLKITSVGVIMFCFIPRAFVSVNLKLSTTQVKVSRACKAIALTDLLLIFLDSSSNIWRAQSYTVGPGWAKAGKQEPHCNSATLSDKASTHLLRVKLRSVTPLSLPLMLSLPGLKQILQCCKPLSAAFPETRPSITAAQSVRNVQVRSGNRSLFQASGGNCIVSLSLDARIVQHLLLYGALIQV